MSTMIRSAAARLWSRTTALPAFATHSTARPRLPFLPHHSLQQHRTRLSRHPAVQLAAVRLVHAETLKLPEIESHHLPLTIVMLAFIGTFVAVNVNLYMTYGKSDILTPLDFVEAPVAQVFAESADSVILRVAANATTDMPPDAGVVHVIVKDDSCQIARPYTPIEINARYMDILVKRYDYGTVSRMLHSLARGDMVFMRGPLRTLKYTPNENAHIGMIAGGTGIAPMYQLMRRILENPADTTTISLVYANRSPRDILLKSRIDELVQLHPGRVHVSYFVDENGPAPISSREKAAAAKAANSVFAATVAAAPSTNDAGSAKSAAAPAAAPASTVPVDYRVGFIGKEHLAKALPGPASAGHHSVIVCGPPGMLAAIAGPKAGDDRPGPLGGMLKDLGFTEQQVVKL
ncbi:hypothetical protein BC831DRAFT_443298 [Entophlyctis helioformis]|nr:hypothetical protein BC831DRAFT_443298 [Entophlyctis helioformis]